MKPKYKNGNGDLCTIIRIDFTILYEDIIMAICLILNEEEKPTKNRVIRQIKSNLKNDGENYNIEGLYTFGIDDSYELEKAAEPIAKKLFPLWIK